VQPRLDYTKAAPAGAIEALYGLEKYIAKPGLERSLMHLIEMRASQINGCAYCLGMHSKDARAEGETEQRLYTLEAWGGDSLLHRRRPRRASLDRSAHAHLSNSCAGRGLRRSQKTF
jgi:AhpD family alkylhydroperoxidase